MTTWGTNGNFHGQAAEVAKGIEYLGDGKWQLPEGAEITAVSSDGDWLLTIEGQQWHVWTEEES